MESRHLPAPDNVRTQSRSRTSAQFFRRHSGMAIEMKRRAFLKQSARVAGGLIAASKLKAIAQSQAESAASSGGQVVIDPTPLFDISPHLYMQFMEPLGATDSSVEAAWDYNA